VNEDFRDLLSALCAADARFLVVGAYAVGVHGHPRATKDLDVWVEASPENAAKVLRALREFGAPLGDLTQQDLEVPGTGFRMGEPPARIEILTTIDAVRFEDAWPKRLEAEFSAGLKCPVIGLADLLVNKRAAARPQDVADVTALERLAEAKGRGSRGT
jgi:hypothetical protein